MPPRITKKSKSKKQISAIPQDLEFMLGEEISSPLDSPLSPTEAEYSLLTASPHDVLENLRLVGLADNETTNERDQYVTSSGKTKQKKPEPSDRRIEYSEGFTQSQTSSGIEREISSNRESSFETDTYSSNLTDSSTQAVRPNDASEKPSKSSKGQKTSTDRRKSSPTKRNVPLGSKRQTIANDRELQLLHSIARHQTSTECLIPKLPFSRLIKETMQQYCGRNLRITPECLLCLQEAAEIYAVQVMEDAYRCTLHRGRITLTAKDMRLALLLRNDSVMM
ncbi:AAEL007783-PA [Aedes aegypti]|uniref:AAEL007783-PA n=1 Tax=Aedes aegypti TaxID=7159 RepID=Q170W9_AEDAE|nr:AAEL007783-PA [Aedes aegypti]